MVALLVCIGLTLVVMACLCDRVLCNESGECRNEYLNDLRANYRDMIEFAARFPRDHRIKSLVNYAGNKYYREAIDGNVRINANEIEAFVQQVCNLDQQGDMPVGGSIKIPQVIMKNVRGVDNMSKKRA